MRPVRGLIRTALVAVAAGAIVGAVVGGLASRLAMRLVAVATDGPIFTLNGARVGAITLDGTFELMQTTAIPGVFAGLLYVAARPALPSSHRAPAFAGLSTVLMGAVFYRDEEFQFFEPRLLAAALFLPFFPIFGYSLAVVVERLDPRPARPWTSTARVAFAVLAAGGSAVVLYHLVGLA